MQRFFIYAKHAMTHVPKGTQGRAGEAYMKKIKLYGLF